MAPPKRIRRNTATGRLIIIEGQSSPVSWGAPRQSQNQRTQPKAGKKPQQPTTPVVPDTSPNTFFFPAMTGTAQSTMFESGSISVSGINTSTPISIVGGEYQINNGPWINTPGTVINGSVVKVRGLSSSAFNTTSSVTLMVGDVTGVFQITTVAADAVPDTFSIPAQSNVALSTAIDSASVTITGMNTSAAISITGGTYSINGGAFMSATTTITSGQSVRVRVTSSASNSTAASAVVTIGGVSATFTVTTLAFVADTTPNAFSFTDQTGVALSTLIESDTLTISGINSATAISVTGGQYSVNGGAYTGTSGTITNGQTVKLRLTSSASNNTAVTATLTIGGISDTFSVTTVAASGGSTPVAASGMDLHYSTDFLTTAKKRDTNGVLQDVSFVISGDHYTPPAGYPWLSRFPYGNVVNNNEAGVYADPTLMDGVNPFPIVNVSGTNVRTLQTGPITNANGYVDNLGSRYYYYSSLITSRWAFTVVDGDYVECDFSCPGIYNNKGQWPAYWLLKAAALHAANEWPPEIDVLEWPQPVYGSNINSYFSNQHRVGGPSISEEINLPAKGVTGNVEARHRYGVKFSSSIIELYVDDILVRSMTNYSPGTEWYVILNNALGGDWPNGGSYPVNGSNGTPPTPNAQTTFPGTMRLYSIKHYRPASTPPSTGSTLTDAYGQDLTDANGNTLENA